MRHQHSALELNFLIKKLDKSEDLRFCNNIMMSCSFSILPRLLSDCLTCDQIPTGILRWKACKMIAITAGSIKVAVVQGVGQSTQ